MNEENKKQLIYNLNLMQALFCGCGDDKIFNEGSKAIKESIEIIDTGINWHIDSTIRKERERAYKIFLNWLHKSGIKITEFAKKTISDDLIGE
jgi:hypothetical protein